MTLNEKVSKTITIVPNTEYPFKALDLQTRHPDPNLRCSLAAAPAGPVTRYTVTLEYTAERPGSFSNSLLIRTDHPDMPQIVIPVTGYVMQPRPESGN
ncbi:hypothetical protein JCM14469_39880 [Desulfatiferula olefinivorans]